MASYVEKFHDNIKTPLNYIMRLRVQDNQIVDLAGNSITNKVNITTDSDGFIVFNSGYMQINNHSILSANEDFTICSWIESYVPTNTSFCSFCSTINCDANPKIGDFSVFGAGSKNGGGSGAITTASWARNTNTANWGTPTDFHSIIGPNTPNELHHLAFVRRRNKLMGFFDGRFCGSYSNVGTQYFRSVNCNVGFGTWDLPEHSTRPFWKGRIKDFCIIKGRALWKSAFKPPTKYLPDEW